MKIQEKINLNFPVIAIEHHSHVSTSVTNEKKIKEGDTSCMHDKHLRNKVSLQKEIIQI